MSSSMLSFAWLRKDTPARQCKDAWAKEEPLNLSEGGTTVALNNSNFQVVKDNLKEQKACYQGLGNLAWLHNEFSIPGTR